jgi:hypothetical protein
VLWGQEQEGARLTSDTATTTTTMSAIPAHDAEKGEKVAHSAHGTHTDESTTSPPSPARTEAQLVEDRATEQKLVYKIDRHVLPFICVMYLLAFLDR